MKTDGYCLRRSPPGHCWMAVGYCLRPDEVGGPCVAVQCSGCMEIGIVWHTSSRELRKVIGAKKALRWPEWRRVAVVCQGPPLEFCND